MTFMEYALKTKQSYDFSRFFNDNECNACTIMITKYNSNNLALCILNRFELELLATINPPFKLEENIIFIKDYDEFKGIFQYLVNYNIIELTGKITQIGNENFIEAKILNLENFCENIFI